ncbi:hypothetical protein [Burkholderia gladioli]|uniref:hypothetical protein n=1 Tax=Burkholderia gladioli TaxID=28095 RepID=UPI0038B3639C
MGDLTNTKLLHEMLRDGGFIFTAPPISQPPPPIGDITTLNFEDNQGKSWALYIFSKRDQASLRFYSALATPNPFFPAGNVLDLINEINVSQLFNSSLDYIKNPLSVRYKAAFEHPSQGLPAYEAMHAIRHHIACSSYLHHLLKEGYKYRASIDASLLSHLIQSTNAILGTQFPPAFL